MWRNVLTFTKKGNDSITVERTEMTKWLNYYGTEWVLDWSGLIAPFHNNMTSILHKKKTIVWNYKSIIQRHAILQDNTTIISTSVNKITIIIKIGFCNILLREVFRTSSVSHTWRRLSNNTTRTMDHKFFDIRIIVWIIVGIRYFKRNYLINMLRIRLFILFA